MVHRSHRVTNFIRCVLAMFLLVMAAGCDGILGIEGLEIGCPDGCVNQTCVKGVCVGDCEAGRKECDEKTPKVCDDQGRWQLGAACEYACFAGSCDCDPGQGRCAENNTLEKCDNERKWTADPCVEQTCLADSKTLTASCLGECAPGKRCLGNTPQVCNALGNWEGQTPCKTNEQCSGGVCACGNGDVRCYENTLQVCTGSTWLDKLGGPCVNQACDVVTQACIGECPPNEKQCDGDGKTPQTCNERGEWVNEAACSFGCADGKCVECAEGTSQCNGQQPQGCVNGQWQDNGSTCDQQTCSDGACVGECAPGKRCLGNTPQTCDAMGKWNNETPCNPGEVCNGGSCTCVTGDVRCFDNTLQACVGSQWSNLQNGPCMDAACDVVTQSCIGECEPNKTQCNADGKTPQLCSESGQWVDVAACAIACVQGGCAACVEGTSQCNGQQPQTCANGQWANVGNACSQQTCNAGVCVGECEPDGKRCAGDVTQTCDVNGQWVDAQACVSPQHCSGGECVVECSTGDLRCLGNTPQTCDGTGAWVDNGACMLQQTCVNGFCTGVCGPSDVGCNGLVPQSCDANGQWKDYPACTGAGGCVSGSCPGASCVGLASDCGPGQNENCCLSPVVSGGTYNRSNDVAYPATVSDFRLDRFEITVGRFRKFVEAYPGSKPASGAGAHPLIANSGWQSAWDASLPVDQAALKTAVKCNASYQTWTEAAGANETLPMNCLSWFEAFAFCAWDGGRLPTEAEWNYAAAGGNEQRPYPWGTASPDATYAVYGCNGNGIGDCVFQDILTSGSKSPKGDGKWGQADLGGSMWEWNLDWYKSLYTPECNNCANLLNGVSRVLRGGSWNLQASLLLSSDRTGGNLVSHFYYVGARCARTP